MNTPESLIHQRHFVCIYLFLVTMLKREHDQHIDIKVFQSCFAYCLLNWIVLESKHLLVRSGHPGSGLIVGVICIVLAGCNILCMVSCCPLYCYIVTYLCWTPPRHFHCAHAGLQQQPPANQEPGPGTCQPIRSRDGVTWPARGTRLLLSRLWASSASDSCLLSSRVNSLLRNWNSSGTI